jgi:hypothetical protein
VIGYGAFGSGKCYMPSVLFREAWVRRVDWILSSYSIYTPDFEDGSRKRFGDARSDVDEQWKRVIVQQYKEAR